MGILNQKQDKVRVVEKLEEMEITSGTKVREVAEALTKFVESNLEENVTTQIGCTTNQNSDEVLTFGGPTAQKGTVTKLITTTKGYIYIGDEGKGITKSKEDGNKGTTCLVQALKELVNKEGPHVVFISETKLHVNKLDAVRRKCGMENCVRVSSKGASGGLAIMWKGEINMKLRSMSKNHIDMEIIEGDSGPN
ncbi:hypothetical protein DITRI_Ditri13aG0071500 [Diplodiscus trichospermus]